MTNTMLVARLGNDNVRTYCDRPYRHHGFKRVDSAYLELLRSYLTFDATLEHMPASATYPLEDWYLACEVRADDILQAALGKKVAANTGQLKATRKRTSVLIAQGKLPKAS